MEKEQIYKILKKVGIGVVAAICLLVLITGANFLFFWSIFGWLTNTIAVSIGIDHGLAKAIAAILMASIVTLPLGRMVRSYSPVPQNNKGTYRGIIFVIIAIFFSLTYFGGRKTFFNSKTGAAMQYYCQWPNGEIHTYSEPGFDPTTGIALKEVTSEISLKINGISAPAPVSSPEVKVQQNTYTPPVEYKSPVYTEPDTTKIIPSSKRKRNEDLLKIDQKDIDRYNPPKQVDPTTGRDYADNGSVNIDYKCLVHFENKSNSTATVTDNYGNLMFRIAGGFTVERKLDPGNYIITYGDQKRNFTLANRQPFYMAIAGSGYNNSGSIRPSHGDRPVRPNYRPGYRN